MAIPCFLLQPTNRYQRFSRRYSRHDGGVPKCPLGTYHNAIEVLGFDELDDHDKAIVYCDGAIPRDTFLGTSFPLHCACGYLFLDEDHSQVGHEQMLRDAATGQQCALRDAPPGAMWHAPWMIPYMQPGRAVDPKGPLIVRMPGGFDWNIDGPASNGGEGWTRTGEPPLVTVNPSIVVPGWHGFLRAGQLEHV